MVGHFGAFSKYGALMIAGKYDDRGATEFYDNLGFKINFYIIDSIIEYYYRFSFDCVFSID